MTDLGASLDLPGEGVLHGLHPVQFLLQSLHALPAARFLLLHNNERPV